MNGLRGGWGCARLVLAASLFLAACASPAARPGSAPAQPIQVLAVETFLADIAQNVAGDRVRVEALIPVGLDPHAFEPAPSDVVKISESQVLIVNGAGLEEWLQRLLDNAGGQRLVIVASQGLSLRVPPPGDPAAAEHPEGDPHFWLDPTKVVRYVENIRDGLSQADPAGADTYAKNAQAYTAQLNDLDQWIMAQVSQVPPARRLLVTNHESFGYFADRYGFKIIGAIVPSVTSNASPSAQEMADLVNRVRATGTPAVFLEVGANTQLADQLASETGIKVVTGLFSHSVSAAGGPAPTYLAMMRYNTNAIVAALK
jgi:ABC-type Zn uptake system ZnuABC Zn-binding protein ZnuA